MAWEWFDYSQGFQELVPTMKGTAVGTTSGCGGQVGWMRGGQMNETLRVDRAL